MFKLVSTFVSELLLGQSKAEGLIYKIRVIYFKNDFSGKQLSLTLRPQSFFPGGPLKGTPPPQIGNQWLAALCCIRLSWEVWEKNTVHLPWVSAHSRDTLQWCAHNDWGRLSQCRRRTGDLVTLLFHFLLPVTWFHLLQTQPAPLSLQSNNAFVGAPLGASEMRDAADHQAALWKPEACCWHCACLAQ